MVANIGVINPTNVEATAYISAVAAFAAVVLVLLLFLGRRWCHSTVFNRKCCDDILAVNPRNPTPCLPIENAQIDALSKPNNFPDRVFAFETSDSDDDLRLRIQQDKEECHYEEKNENASAPVKLEVELVETALRETTLRETKIDDVVPQRTEYLHTLEAQSSVDSDVIAHNDTSLLCGESSQERGSIELTLLYDAPVRCMTVHVLQGRSLPLKTTGQILQSQVRVVLLPLKKQKFKSKIRNGENPQYMESFVLHKMNPEDVHGLGLRIRVYGCERMRRQRLLGEAAVSFASLNLELENNLWLQLAPRQHHQTSLQLPKLELTSTITGVLASPSSIATVTTPSAGAAGGEACSLARSDSASSCCSARSAPELLLGLQYNSTTGHLSVEIIKGTHFRKLSPNKAPDTYVKLCLISSLGMEMGRCKSTTRRAQSNPLYKELFIFQVALFQLSEVTLMVSVWWRRSVKRNEMVGWFSLGHSSSGREEERHWRELCDRQGEQVQRWHVLLDS
ncbi:synaptotagmin-16 [Bombyx mandarina]|uniref:C2 domain-containing protein n=2 Tax=Bombyx TaxID=7090 RepID=A0A8R2RBE7_BOMMO|nr:synaptotagmin-16 [Bombyx mandarina]XP_037876308.1 synaptotagmin-16 isoform X2 [Bombyx mori]XP_037876309.1 synaptotagmin-16 isoform X2 [Bombyx mori]